MARPVCGPGCLAMHELTCPSGNMPSSHFLAWRRKPSLAAAPSKTWREYAPQWIRFTIHPRATSPGSNGNLGRTARSRADAAQPNRGASMRADAQSADPGSIPFKAIVLTGAIRPDFPDSSRYLKGSLGGPSDRRCGPCHALATTHSSTGTPSPPLWRKRRASAPNTLRASEDSDGPIRGL